MIEITDLTKKFGDNVVLDNFCANIEHGKVTALTSPSGKGKTTLLRILSSIDKKYTGNISGIGSISYCPQGVSLLPWYDTMKNLTTFLGSTPEMIERINEALEIFGLSDAKSKKPGEMSGGMCQRVAIIRAWLKDSDTVLLDEPFKGLDSETKLQVITYLKQHKNADRTVIFATHSEDEINLFADNTLSL